MLISDTDDNSIFLLSGNDENFWRISMYFKTGIYE